MNSKKLCCICVLFSLLAGCASESSIDEKKKKAQVTQSNINKNTPQQLTDKDLFGNETTLAVSEEDIQAALDGDEFRVPLNSPVILVQSGNRAPETIMQEEMRKYYTVSTFSGIPDRQKPLTCNKNKDKNENEDVNRPGFPGECFICELRLPDHRFRWKHNKLFLLLPVGYGPAFPAIVDCYTSPPTLVWPVPLLSGFSNSYGVLPPLCKDH